MITDIVKRNILRESNGLPPIKIRGKLLLKDVYRTNWSWKFEQYMRNRLAMGYFRYGPLNKQEKGKYDLIGSIKKRIDKYVESGNDELLVDVANLCMVEFINGVHPKKHFSSEDDGEHVQVIK